MTLSLRDRLNQAPPNQLPDLLRAINIGDVIAGNVNQQIRKANPGVAGANSVYDLASESVLVLPFHQRAARVNRCTVRAGGTTGEYLEKAGYGVTPSTATVAVTPCGNLAFLGTDVVTDADITYTTENGDVLELFLPCVPGTGVCALPAGLVTQGVILLLEAEVLTGTTKGTKIVLVPAAAAVATTFAALKVDKGSVWFAIADAATRVRVKLLVVPAKRLNVLLAGDTPV